MLSKTIRNSVRVIFDWEESLALVTTETFILWHGKGFKLYWRWKARCGRPALPKEIRQFIARTVKESVTCGEERIAAGERFGRDG